MEKRVTRSQSKTMLNYFQSSNSNKKRSKCDDPKEQPSNSSDDAEVLQPAKKRSRKITNSDVNKNDIKERIKTSKRANIESLCAVQSTSTAVKEFHTETSPEVSRQVKRWPHESLEFLQPQHIQDINKNRPDDPNYDPKTLYIPNDFLDDLTPVMRQWWIFKSNHFDCVLFFKVGNNYLLYHMDAVVGVKHLCFTYTKVDFAQSGFPENGYEKMASSLMEQGFKVARVEQVETQQMNEDRCRLDASLTNYDKVVKREICEISIKGVCLLRAKTDAINPHSSYMMAIVERIINKNKQRKKEFGVCFVDITIGTFYLSEFEDDMVCSRLLCLLVEHPPSLILTERGGFSSSTNNVLKKSFGEVKKEILTPEQFLRARTLIQKFHTECYFKNEKDEVCLPKLLERCIDCAAPKSYCELKLKAFGGVFWYLQVCKIDIQLISMGKFESYFPPSILDTPKTFNQAHMVLDSTCLSNLNILGGEGTLQNALDFCCTPFGKRLLRNWICHPLCDFKMIQQRQASVVELFNKNNLLMQTRDLMGKLPDLERQISKIHIFGNRHVAKFHPDSHAISLESKLYTKRKIIDFISTLEAFEKCLNLPRMFKECTSPLLRYLTKFPAKGVFGDVRDSLKFFRKTFDYQTAKRLGYIVPTTKFDNEYDECERSIKKARDNLHGYLQEQRTFFQCQVNYYGDDNQRFQIEVPATKSHLATDDYRLEGTRKGNQPVNRYSTEKSRKLAFEIETTDAKRSSILQDLNRRIFEKFTKDCEELNAVIASVAILDCLCSLAWYARKYLGNICVPSIQHFVDKPFFTIKNSRHPCINNDGNNFTPNDVEFAKHEQKNILMLTGPNKSGKSTLMRQVVLTSIIAQIGGLVPATSCEMSLVDRIFARLDPHEHRSTVLVELEEASSILKHASCHSFIVIDELGRRTSTHHNGNALVTSYVKALSKINCRTIFSTHFHDIVKYYEGHKNIQLGYMTFDEGPNKEKVTFLYKMERGIFPKLCYSNLALLAESVVKTEEVDQASNLVSGLKL